MKTSLRFYLAFFLLFGIFYSLLLYSCRKDKGALDYTPSGYPQEIGKIIIGKCATPGCHTSRSKDASAGISLETWNALFAGGKSGACCIPYSHEYSTLFLFTNTDPAKGAVNMPAMPLNREALSKEEMKTLTDWIDAGAPNAEGKIMWADNPNRKKFYVTNQGCDVVTVFDAATLLQMRYIKIGVSPGIESPHMVKLSADEKYWYACFSNTGTILEKHRVDDESYVGQALIGPGLWNTFTVSNDSKYAYVVDWSPSGKITPVDLTTMTTLPSWSGLFQSPHGSSINPNGDTVYITSQSGNSIYKTPVNDPGSLIDILADPPQPINTSVIEPHDIIWSPDSSKYFVTCSKSNDVRVFLRSNDSLIAKIPTGDYPVELAISKTTSYLFVTCMYDTSGAGNRGSVTVINYQTLLKITNIKGINIAEPHGIGIDDERGLVYVANRNLSGPLPHHSTSCGGKIGFISFIDLNTLNLLPYKREVAVDPYSIAVKY